MCCVKKKKCHNFFFGKLTYETCIFKETEPQTLAKLLADLSEWLIRGKVCLLHRHHSIKDHLREVKGLQTEMRNASNLDLSLTEGMSCR